VADAADLHSRLADLAALAQSLAQATQERRVALKKLQQPPVDAIACVLARDLAALRDDVERMSGAPSKHLLDGDSSRRTQDLLGVASD
jgi:hypothetical protein